MEGLPQGPSPQLSVFSFSHKASIYGIGLVIFYYSILSFVNEFWVRIADEMDFGPDYSLSAAEGYRTFAAANIKQSLTLDVLNVSGLRARADLPFWAPDWSHLRASERSTWN